MPTNIRRIETLMRGHEAKAFKAPSRWGSGWYAGPRIGTGSRMHGDAFPAYYDPAPLPKNAWWNYLTTWFMAFGEEDPNNPYATLYTASNTRIQVRNIRLFVRKASWSLVQTVAAPISDDWSYSVTGGVLGTDYRVESAGNGGGTSHKIKNGATQVPHGYGEIAYISDPWNVTGIAVDMECRLILDNPAGTDDRANAKAVMGVACDLYYNYGSPSPAVGYWEGVAVAGFARITNDWQTIGFNTYFTGSRPEMYVETLRTAYSSDLILADPPPDWTDGGGAVTPPLPPPPVGATKRLMFLGDSNTLGSEQLSTGYRSFRGKVLADLAAAGLNIDAIGLRQSTPAIGGDPDCEGYGGAFISHPSDTNNLFGRLPNIMAAAGTLDIVVLMAGWNDVYNYSTNVPDRWATQLFSEVRRYQPNAAIVVCTLPPQRGETEAQTAATYPHYGALNTRIRQTAQQAGVLLADCATAALVSSDYWDVIHWLQPGADKVGAIISTAIINSTPTIPSPAPGDNYVIPGTPKLLNVFPIETSARLTVATGGPRLIVPAINTTTISGATVSVPYSVTLDVSGDPVPTLSVTAGALPSWMSISGRTLSGTPPGNAAATFDFTLTATNTAGTSPAVRYTGTVSTLPTVTVGTPARMTVGTAAYIPLTATGTGPFLWFLDGTSPALPAGLSISGDAIVGIPSATYSNAIVLRASGPGGQSAATAVPLAVDAVFVAPTPSTGSWERIERDVQVWVRVPRD